MYIVYNHLLICGHIQALSVMQCTVLKDVYFTRAMNVLHIAFSALTLLVEVWRGYLSGARCK